MSIAASPPPATASSDLTVIDRHVNIDAPPIRVAAALAPSLWRHGLRIEPAGAGSRVLISARVEPDGLARTIEAAALSEVCQLKGVLETESGSPSAEHPSTKPTTTRMRRTTMTTIERSVTIDAPTEKVWAALADFGGIAAWNPAVATSRLTSTETDGTGITRECELSPMGAINERVTGWEEGRLLSVEIYHFKNLPGMRKGIASFQLDDGGASTDVRLRLDYEVGLGPMGAGMNAVMMKRRFTANVTKMLAGLKLHVETGQPVEKGADLPIAAVAA